MTRRVLQVVLRNALTVCAVHAQQPAPIPIRTLAPVVAKTSITFTRVDGVRLLYDVINQKGEIFERVQLPAECDVAGFGKGGVVYLTLRDGQKYYIEKTRIQR